jgi:hypothetical protein
MMDRKPPAETPDAYVRALRGWKKALVSELRAAVQGAASFEEAIKWGHLVYLHEGPALLIRAEDERVLFGFWRGQRLRKVEPRLKPGGKYEMATLELRRGDALDPGIAARLAAEAARLNAKHGDPTSAAKAGSSPARA